MGVCVANLFILGYYYTRIDHSHSTNPLADANALLQLASTPSASPSSAIVDSNPLKVAGKSLDFLGKLLMDTDF